MNWFMINSNIIKCKLILLMLFFNRYFKLNIIMLIIKNKNIVLKNKTSLDKNAFILLQIYKNYISCFSFFLKVVILYRNIVNNNNIKIYIQKTCFTFSIYFFLLVDCIFYLTLD